MTWLLLSLFTAASVAARDAILKRGSTQLDEYRSLLAITSTTVFVLALPFLFVPFPRPGPRLAEALIGSGGPNIVAYVLLAKAVKYSDLSLVAPLMGLTPLFLLVTSPLIVGEVPGALGIVGVLLIVCGAYVLNLRDIRRGALEPLRAIARDRGARLMLGVALLWSISANYDKVGVEASSVLAWPLLVNAVMALAMLGMVAARARGGWRDSPHRMAAADGALEPHRPRRRETGYLLIGGVVNAASIVAQMTALTLTLVPYVIAVKRTSVLFSVLIGALLFRESRIRERAAGALLILAGVILFALQGEP